MLKCKRVLSSMVALVFIFLVMKPPAPIMAAGEAPAQFRSVSYKLTKNIKELPNLLEYNLKPMTLDQILGKEALVKGTINNNTSSISTKKLPMLPSGSNKLQTNEQQSSTTTTSQGKEQQYVKDIKYPVESRIMTVGRNFANFNPKIGEIYIDKLRNKALKVLDEPTTDGQGNYIVPVATPEFSEVFEYYKIPEQTVGLTRGNISFMVPEAEMISDRIASSDNNFVARMSSNQEHKIRIKNLVLYNSSSSEKDDKEKDKDMANSKDNGEPDSFKKSDEEKQEEKTQHTDLRGVNERDKFSVKITLDEAIVTISNPTIKPNVDIGLLEQKININFNAETRIDATITGEMKIDKVIEKLIYGYDVEIPYGRVFVGVFLVVDVKGQVTAVVKTFTTGSLDAGYGVEAALFVPYYVGPYVRFTPKTFGAGITVDGQVHAVAAAVPQVGLNILDIDVAVLQLWMGVEGDVKFHAEGGSGTANRSDGRLKLDAFLNFFAIVFGKKVDIYNTVIPLYEGSWSTGQSTASGAGEDIPVVIDIRANAYSDVVEGYVNYASDRSKSYIGDGIKIHVKRKDGTTRTFDVGTDSYGSFRLVVQPFGIRPNDTVRAEINKPSVDGVVKGMSQEITPVTPFDKISFKVDAFNDVVYGNLPVNDFNGAVYVYVKNASGIKRYGTTAKNGEFIAENVTLVGGDQVTAQVSFENVILPRNPEPKKPNLDSLHVFFDTKQGKGTIANMAGPRASAYTGKVTLSTKYADGTEATMTTQAKSVYEVNKNTNNSKNPLTPNIINQPSQAMQVLGKNKNISQFYFTNVSSLYYLIKIEHEGLVKTLKYDPLGELLDKIKPLQHDVTSPVDNKVDPIINNPWIGVWESDMGTMVFTEKNGKIKGNHALMDLTIEGTVSGNTFKGTYYYGNEKGTVELVMLSNGKYSGKLSSGKILRTISGEKRNMQVKIPSSAQIDSAISLPSGVSSWSGVWDSDFGTIILAQEGTKVFGTYGKNSSLEGTVSGNVLKGTFNQMGVKGVFEFTISSDGKSFSGMHRFDREDEWSDWEGNMIEKEW